MPSCPTSCSDTSSSGPAPSPGRESTPCAMILEGSTTALAGMSGTGKSSLVSAVQPGLDLRVSAVSDSGEGRHTTTQATMLGLDGGGFVVDTPGVREFGLTGLRRRELAAFYPEIARLAPGCRFSDCAHLEEPGVRGERREGERRRA